MSFYDDASLVFLPSGGAGKDTKAYSIKPTDGSGDFTFSRGSNLTATRVDSNGIIEKGRENLLLQSNQFDTTWALIRTNISGGQSGYDGSTDAWLFQPTNVTPAISQSVSNSGVGTYSVYAKANSVNWIRLQLGGSPSPSVYFDLDPNTIGNRIGTQANNIDASIQDIGSGWFRCSVTFSSSVTSALIFPAKDDNVVGDINSTIYIQDAQLEQGLVATEYIESGATTGKAGILEDSPRFDYSGGASCPSLLLEPSRTNEIGYSEYFEGWTEQGSPTITSNFGTSPEGVQNSSRLRYTTEEDYIETSVTNTSGVFSIYAKGTGNLILTDSGANASSTTALTSSYQRIDLYFSTNTTTLQIKTDSSGLDAEVYGAQFENATYETSYIPNHSGGSVTREAESFSGTQDLTNIFTDSSQGTIYFEIEDLGHRPSGAAAVFRYGSATDSLQMAIYVDNNGVKFYFYNKGAFLISANTDVGSTYKFAIVFNGTSLTGFRNTTKYGPLTDDETFDVTRVTDMNFQTNSVKMKKIIYFPSALSDAECITLTS